MKFFCSTQNIQGANICIFYITKLSEEGVKEVKGVKLLRLHKGEQMRNLSNIKVVKLIEKIVSDCIYL